MAHEVRKCLSKFYNYAVARELVTARPPVHRRPASASRTARGGDGGAAYRSASPVARRPRWRACCRQRWWWSLARASGWPPFRRLVRAGPRRPLAQPRAGLSATTGAKGRRPGSRRRRRPRGPGRWGPRRPCHRPPRCRLVQCMAPDFTARLLTVPVTSMEISSAMSRCSTSLLR